MGEEVRRVLRTIQAKLWGEKTTSNATRSKRAVRLCFWGTRSGLLYWNSQDWQSKKSNISGCSAVGSAPALGVPWRYPGRGIVKRRKALQHLRLLDFPRLPKAAQKRLWPHKWPQTEKALFLPLAVVSWQKSEYPGIAKLVSRLVWDQETVRSSRTTRTKIPLKSLISEGFFLFFVYCGASGENFGD